MVVDVFTLSEVSLKKLLKTKIVKNLRSRSNQSKTVQLYSFVQDISIFLFILLKCLAASMMSDQENWNILVINP